jgi:GntR family transcriptional regulator
MTISGDDDRAPYVQVADALREEIRSGQLAPGQKLPSTRQLAERFGVAVMTASSGLRVLREEGLTYSTQGRGTFVSREGSPAKSPTAHRRPPVDLSSRVSELESEVQKLAERLSEVESLINTQAGV